MSTTAHHLVLFDSDCPLCTFQMKTLTWLDWLDKVRFVPIKEAAENGTAPPELTREQLIEAIHCLTPKGEIHRGARAIRFLGMRMPLLIPVGLFLHLPGVIWIAEKVYQWISKNRLFFSKVFGCQGACAIMPQRERDGEES